MLFLHSAGSRSSAGPVFHSPPRRVPSTSQNPRNVNNFGPIWPRAGAGGRDRTQTLLPGTSIAICAVVLDTPRPLASLPADLLHTCPVCGHEMAVMVADLPKGRLTQCASCGELDYRRKVLAVSHAARAAVES